MGQGILELFARPSAAEYVNLLSVSVSIGVLVVASEFIRKRFHWSAEFTRKLVHISVGILIFFAPELFHSAVIPLSLAFLGSVVMAFAVRKGLLVGMHGTKRASYGTVFYPAAFFLLVIILWNRHAEILSLSMLGFALGDAAAAIVGESLPSPKIFRLTSDKKSIEGSSVMFLTTTGSIFVGAMVLDFPPDYSPESKMAIAAIAASIATAWEAISSKGFDNFTVPLSIALVLSILILPSPLQNTMRFALGVIVSSFFVIAAYRLQYLTADGSVTAFLLATCVYGLGDWKWAIPIVAFFVFSSLVSKAGRRQKIKYQGSFEKTSTRDWGQAAANGGVAGFLMLAQYFWPAIDFYPAYVGSLTAAAADTWGTEIGVWFHAKTYSLSTLRAVKPGSNGGVSLPGFIGGALGAVVVASSTLAWVHNGSFILTFLLAGIAGSVTDSLVGGTLQATYRCPICKKETERATHCGTACKLYRGIQWINNDVVNWMCTAVGAAVAGAAS
jgi:uncharacterized protein (TIGR00297 family)